MKENGRDGKAPSFSANFIDKLKVFFLYMSLTELI